MLASRSELDGTHDRDKFPVHVEEEGEEDRLDANKIDGLVRVVPRDDFSQETLVCFFNAPRIQDGMKM